MRSLKMKLDIHQIKSVTQGVVKVEYKDSAYRFYRMTESEYNLSDKSIAEATASVILEFKTDASYLKLNVKTKLSMNIRSFFAFDIFEDNKRLYCIKNFEDENCITDYSNEKYDIGSYSGNFKLKNGDKTIKIYMPHTLIGSIEEIELSDATYITPLKKDKLLIAYGDSITQGYDAQHPSEIYATRLGEYLGAEVINKAIGGAIFEHKLIDGSVNKKADYVSVAFGTNDWTVFEPDKIRKNAYEYIKTIVSEYPDAVKFVITPIWREAADTEKIGGTFDGLEKIITEACATYPDVIVIPGIDLIEHSTEYFGDSGLHPNDKGFSLYAQNLIDKISKR